MLNRCIFRRRWQFMWVLGIIQCLLVFQVHFVFHWVRFYFSVLSRIEILCWVVSVFFVLSHIGISVSSLITFICAESVWNSVRCTFYNSVLSIVIFRRLSLSDICMCRCLGVVTIREYWVSNLSHHVDHMAASAAHVAHCVLVLACAGAKNWFIVEFVLAIWSTFLGLPGFLVDLTYVVVGLLTTRIASLLDSRFYI